MQTQWIVGKYYDLALLLGPNVLSTCIVFVFYAFPFLFEPLYWFFMYAFCITNIVRFIVDGPHLWGTIVRTYFDKQERKTRPLLLYGSLLVPALFIFCVPLNEILGTSVPTRMSQAFIYLWYVCKCCDLPFEGESTTLPGNTMDSLFCTSKKIMI